MQLSSTRIRALYVVLSLALWAGGASAAKAAGAANVLPGAPILLLGAGSVEGLANCIADDETLCLLENQVQIRVRFRNQRDGTQEGTGKAAPLGDRTGTFWFFREDNIEIVVKALDGRERNGHFWIFLGSLSDLEFWVEATEVASGNSTTYYNPPGHLFGIADVNALGPEAGTLCGTIQGFTCEEGFFCEVIGSCQLADPAGTCTLIPEICTTHFNPVCGCDGATYGNDCERRRAQVQRDHFGACEEAP